MLTHKKYVIEFKLFDGTTKSVPIEIPIGEQGGYYLPKVDVVEDWITFSFQPSDMSMPPIEDVSVELLKGYATTKWAEDKFQAKGDYLATTALPAAINAALQKAQESGVFNGKDGYTPVKGVDYFDGVNGKDGADGYTPVKGVDYFDGKDGVDGKTPVKGVDYFDGQPGKDGVPGADGKTPEKGVDYFTEADKQEIVDDVVDKMDDYLPTISVELPVFDLSALGMSAITLPTGYATVSTDTTALQSALREGSVIFVIPVDMGGTTIPVRTTMQGIALGTSYQCTSLFVLNDTSALVINVDPGSITVMVMPASTAVGFPVVSEADNGKFMQVVNGSWAAVALQDVSEVGA